MKDKTTKQQYKNVVIPEYWEELQLKDIDIQHDLLSSGKRLVNGSWEILPETLGKIW